MRVSMSVSVLMHAWSSTCEGGRDVWELGEAGGGVNQRSSLVLQMRGRDQGLGQFPLSSPMFALMVTSLWVLFIVQIPDTKPDAIYLL